MTTPLESSREGLLIMGTDASCGKTVITAGLAAAITEGGFRMQALKPLDFAPEVSLKRGQDQAFINKVSQQYMQLDTLYTSSAWEVSALTWSRWLEPCKNLQYPCLLEAPGQVTSPWQILNGKITDGSDVAKQLGIPVLLVGRAEPAFLDKMIASLTVLQARGITPIGFIRVYTQPEAADSEFSQAETLLMSQKYGVPFLGELPFSLSISVPGMQQGNLIRLVQENIDLLPLQLEIGLTL